MEEATRERLYSVGSRYSDPEAGHYLLWSVDIFVESFEGIDVELHKLSKEIKVALEDIS